MMAGKADTLPLFPDDPYIAANRRVTITLMNEEPPIPTTEGRDVHLGGVCHADREGRPALWACVGGMVKSRRQGHVEMPG